MSTATYQQTSFLGGEWTRSAHGRSDDPRYHTALAAMRNAMPSEQAAFTRRSGSLGIIPTRNRAYAKLLALESTTALPYVMEFTDDSLRFIFGTSPVFTNDPAIVSAVVFQGGGNLILTTSAAHGWTAGDDLMFWFPIDYPVSNEAGLRGRVLQVVASAQGSTTSGTTLCLADEVGQPTLPDPGTGGPTFATDGTPILFRIQRLTTTIAGADTLRLLRCIRTSNSGVIVQGTFAPQQVSITTASAPPADPVFSIAPAPVVDGPYSAMMPDTATVSGFSGTITLTPASSTFTSGDVGRCIRLFSEPPDWAIGTTYAYGALVKYNGAYWQSTQAGNVGSYPGSSSLSGGVMMLFWTPAPNSQRWVWGTITAQAGSSCTVALGSDLSNQNGVPVGATNVIPSANGTTISQWQMGLWSGVNGYPICGIFHEGRMFFSGPIGNRFDSSVSGEIFTFSPTDQYGNVNDNSAISYVLSQDDTLYWMRDDDRGIIAGGLKGEWLISAAVEGEAMSSPNSKARRVTEYKSAQIEPVRSGGSIVFAQRYKRHIFEYLVDSFSGRFGGKPLNDFATNFTEGEVAEMACTDEPTPIIWARMNDGSLAAATYRRVSRFITEAPIFNAWHGHVIGDTRVVEALCGVADSGGGDTACQVLLSPSVIVGDTTGGGDRLYMVTNAPSLSARAPSDRLIEVMQPMVQDEDEFAAGWFTDSGPGTGKHIVAANVAGTAVFCSPLGGVRGQDGQSGGTESADLGLRALGTPGAGTFSNLAGNPTRVAYLAGFADSNCVYFNGYSALSGLPRAAGGSKNFTLSVWLNLANSPTFRVGGDLNPSASATKGQGFILGAQPVLGVGQTTTYVKLPLSFTTEVDVGDSGTFNTAAGRTVILHGPAYNTDGTQWLAPGASVYAKAVQHSDFVSVSRTQPPFYRTWLLRPSVPATPQADAWSTTMGIAAPDVPLDYLSEGSNAWIGNAYNANPGAPKNDGWFHLMISVKWNDQGTHNTVPISSTFSHAHLQVYVNDTAYFDGTTMQLGLAGGVAGPYAEPADLLMAQLADWFIGGRMPGNLQSCIPDDGTGLVGAMTELYINTAEFIDLSISANRSLFHSVSNDGLTYAPVNLGAHGATPTGSKPLIYCTGGPSVFHQNRAKKNHALVVHNNYPDAQHLVANQLGEPLLLDSFDGPVVS